MTKLEQKLIELGYVKLNDNLDGGVKTYLKRFNTSTRFEIYINNNCYYGNCISERRYITQDVIDYLQQAFNQLQKDLEVLKEYEEKD